MGRFIEMWLMLRLLKDQEEHFICVDKRSPAYISRGIRASVGIPNFIAYCSQKNLLIGFLPFWIMKWFRPGTPVEYTNKKAKIEKMRSLYSLFDSAKSYGYINYGKKLAKDGQLKEVDDRIRISESGDDFITYFGGLESLLKKYPKAWSLLVFSLLPWLITHKDLLQKLINQ